MGTPDSGSHPVDERLLVALRERRLDYPTTLAYATEVDAASVTDRLEALAAAGLVERVTPEPVYRLTVAGMASLEGNGRVQGSAATGARLRAGEGTEGPAPSS